MSEAYGTSVVPSLRTDDMDTKGKLKVLCKSKGWSQARMLREAGNPIADSTYSQYLKNPESDLTLHSAYAIARALNVDLAWLADDQAELPPPSFERSSSEGASSLTEDERFILRLVRGMPMDYVIKQLVPTPPSDKLPQTMESLSNQLNVLLRVIDELRQQTG